jgi:hypothetical protein
VCGGGAGEGGGSGVFSFRLLATRLRVRRIFRTPSLGPAYQYFWPITLYKSTGEFPLDGVATSFQMPRPLIINDANNARMSLASRVFNVLSQLFLTSAARSSRIPMYRIYVTPANVAYRLCIAIAGRPPPLSKSTSLTLPTLSSGATMSLWR